MATGRIVAMGIPRWTGILGRVTGRTEDRRTTSRAKRGPALILVLASCGGDHPGPPATDAPVGMDATPDASRSPLCASEGTSVVSGSGPDGLLDGRHVHALVLTGFCSDELQLIVTTEDALATPYLDHSGEIHALVGQRFRESTAAWSGTFAATIARPDGTAPATGTLQVDSATPAGVRPTRLRATARFDDHDWQLSAMIDAPYCRIVECL